jgi:pimeloyl-ACP methyl ester carboxylesterase
VTETATGQGRLIVFVPDRTGEMTALKPLVKFLRNQPELKEARFIDDIEFKMWAGSNRNLYKVASYINFRINEYYLKNRDSISGITLCGYSLGVLLLRRAYLDACGYNKAGAVAPWAAHVDRIVLIAAICRGFNPKRFKWYERIGMSVLKVFGLGRALRSAFEGQPLVTNTRLDWVDRMHYKPGPKPMVVNFLGDQDDLVKPDDAIDILQDPDARPIPLAGEDHDSIIDPVIAPESYRLGFLGEPARGRPIVVPNYKRTDSIYILLHGMRSSQAFMEELKRTLRSKYPQADVRKPDYGYIPLGLFLSRAHRIRTAARLADDYTQARSLNPHAQINFVGHSNGTAILGYALREHPNMKFERVYLGGSVLPTNFDWRTVKDRRGQVSVVRSDRGSTDWAVGILARALERSSRLVWSFEGLGSAGYDGFAATDVSATWMNELTFEGGHSSMFTTERLQSIVDFLTAETPPNEPGQTAKTPAWFSILHKQADWLVPVAALAVIAIMVMSLLPTVFPSPYLAALGGPYLGVGIGAVTLYALVRL